MTINKRDTSEESNEADNPQLNWITKSLGVDQPEPDMHANFAKTVVAEATEEDPPVEQPNQSANAGLFGSNPFTNLASQYKTITAMQQQEKVSDFSIFSNRHSPGVEPRLNSVQPAVADESNEQRQFMTEMLDASFLHMPLLQDQQGLDIRCPTMIEEGVDFLSDEAAKTQFREEFVTTRGFPT